jgi:hypothetical protein
VNSNDELDRILDQALCEYQDAEPLAGMEDRILRRVAGQPARKQSFRWAVALAAAGITVVALWLGLRTRPHQPITATNIPQATQQVSPKAAQVEPSSQRDHPSGRQAEVGRARARQPLPKQNVQVAQSLPRKPALEQFPTPAPMTSEEHALLALARTHPDALLVRLDDADKLSIAPIEIKPLASEAGAPQGEQ